LETHCQLTAQFCCLFLARNLLIGILTQNSVPCHTAQLPHSKSQQWEIINESKPLQLFRHRLRLYQIDKLQRQISSKNTESQELRDNLDQILAKLRTTKKELAHKDIELKTEQLEKENMKKHLISPSKMNRTISSYMYDMLSEISAVISVNFGRPDVDLPEQDNVEENISRVLESISQAASEHRQRDHEMVQLQERLAQTEEELAKMHVYLEEVFEEYKDLNDKKSQLEEMEVRILSQKKDLELTASKIQKQQQKSLQTGAPDQVKSPSMKQQSRTAVTRTNSKSRSSRIWDMTPVRLFQRS